MTDFHVVSYVILQREDEVLLARRAGVSFANGLWSLPGGHVEPGETLAEAASREVLEEVGVRVAADALTPIGMCRYTDDGVAGLDLFFTARTYDGDPQPLSECDRVAWCRPTELPDPPVPWLPRALQRHLVEAAWFDELVR